MKKQLLHTPEGVRDIYGEECAQKLAVQEKLMKVFHLYGYQNIETPTFEFFDIFSKERGSVSSREMFKFFDRDNNTLVLRPDMTPPIARCVTKYFMEETLPVRLCYLAKTFINNTHYQGRLKESTQTGVELISDDSIDADAEMIAMTIAALKATGLQEFQVEMGQVEFFRGLVDEAGIDADTQETLRDLIENKNYFGVEELLESCDISDELQSVFLKLPELFGNIDQMRLAKTLTSNPRAQKAIERLEKVQDILDIYGLGDYVSYDLGMLSKYSYYTGIIFKAYTYGMGDHIATGGRYDKLLDQFGKKAPAIGFCIMVDRLMMALSRQKIDQNPDMVKTMILYDSSAQRNAIRLADHFREHQNAVILVRRQPDCPDNSYRKYAERMNLRNILVLTADGSDVALTDIVKQQTDILKFTDYVTECTDGRK